MLPTARSKVSGAVYAQESAIREGVSAVVKEKVLGGVLAALGQQMTPEEYHAAVSAGQIPAETAAQIDGAVSAKMQEAEITAQIDAAVSEQEQLLIEENMNSSEVRYQIDAAIQKAKSGESSISALKAQLDSYAKFYQGLLDYTAGVASADAGAAKLDEGALSIRDGAGKLEEGASALESGASALSEGICALKDGGNALTGGVTQLRDLVNTFEKPVKFFYAPFRLSCLPTLCRKFFPCFGFLLCTHIRNCSSWLATQEITSRRCAGTPCSSTTVRIKCVGQTSFPFSLEVEHTKWSCLASKFLLVQ